jgi:hypothetical protein
MTASPRQGEPWQASAAPFGADAISTAPNPELSAAKPNGRRRPNGRADYTAPLDKVYGTLLENGYSPVALIGKRPIDPGWTELCKRTMTSDEVAKHKGKDRNVGAATGYRQLLGVDIDTDDTAIIAAIRSVIPESSVAKRGQTGRTDFYRAPGGAPPASRRFVDKNGEIILELLGDGRQTAIPPSIHPDTGKPYTWLTDATLLDTCVEDLPESPADLAARLEQALRPWLAEEKPARPQRSGPPPDLTDAMRKRHRAWALKALNARMSELRGKSKPGRNRTLFEMVCALGKFVHHGIITDAELRAPALDACRTNGLAAENRIRDCESTIDKGLRYALGDQLEDLPERDRGKASKPGARAKAAGNGATPPPRDPLGDRPSGDNEPAAGPRPSAPPSETSAFVLTPGAISWPELTKKGMAVDRSQANVRHFLNACGAVLSFNAFTEQPSITVDDVTWPVNDDIVARIRMAMHREGFNPGERFFEVALLDLALENSRHPVREYLAGLQWDGVPRLDTWLPTYLGAEDTELHRAWGRCHLLAAVKRVLEPGAKHDAILVLEGDQGIGKSRAIAVLAGKFFTDALKVGLDSKEIIELTDGCWLVEYPELEGITGREMSSVKAQLSRCSDRARLAYGRSTTERFRQWVAFGTVNERSYLRDHTGNRRFWTVEVTKIDLAALARDRDQIWAEAYYRLAQGETHELPESLYAAAAEAQSKRVLETPWEMRLEPTLDGVVGRIAVEHLFEFLSIAAHRQDGKVGAQLNRAMVKLKWRKTQQRRDGIRHHCYERKPAAGQSRWLRFDPVTRRWVES